MATTKPTQGGAAGHTPEPGTQERNQKGTESQGLQGSEAGQQVEVGQSGGAMDERRGGGMARYGRDPFAVMQRLSEEMDELFETFFYGRPAGRAGRQQELRNLWAPEVELCEEGNQVRVCVDLPGVPKENVKIDIHEGMLIIQGERREERTEGAEQGFRRSERRYGSFYRSIPLPEGAEADQAQARMKDGVLEITLPMAQRKQGRRLEIQG